MRHRVGDGQQQAVGGGERRRQAAGRHEARDHVGQTGDFRGCQHDQVAADDDFRQLHDAVLVDVGNVHQRLVHRGPVTDPGRQRREAGAYQVAIHLELGQDRQAGAVKYSRKMKNNPQNTETRASCTEGVV